MKGGITAMRNAAFVFCFLLQFGRESVAVETPVNPQASATREVHYATIAGSSRSITEMELANQVAAEFPDASAYGKFRVINEKRDSRGVYGLIKAGVVASADRNKVHLEWTSADQTIGGSTAASTTYCELVVEPQSGVPGTFTITSTRLEEKIGHDPIIFFQKRPPLDSLERIQADLVATLQKLPLEFTFPLASKEEVDAPYPPASVFGNFERRLEKPTENTSTGDVRAGTFPAGDRDNPSRWVSVKVFPFHAGSKVELTFNATYKLRPDGTSTAESFKPFVERMKAIALE